jgi:hypothetical protein
MVTIHVNDLNIKNLPIKLRIKMETMGVTIENPPTINTTPVYVDGGTTSILFGKDLTDYFNINNLIFKGYSKKAYSRTGQLPEGFYKITVEVLHFNSNRLISNQGTTTAWINLGKPPILKLPENNAQMGEFKGMPLTFSWLSSNVGSPVSANTIQYKFEMWEMRVSGINPNTVAASIPVFHEYTSFNTAYSLYPVTLLMEPGMQYAWRVTASDLSGFVPFEQNGQSEIRTFTYKTLCDSVTGFTSSLRGQSGAFSWQPDENHTSFNVEMRKPETNWFLNSQAYENKAEFFDLDFGATYQMRVQAVCNGDPDSKSDFSSWQSLTVPEQKPLIDTASCPDCQCDDQLPDVELQNFELREDLKVGDTIINKTGTTRYILKTIEPQGNGIYKGVFLFWAEIWNLKFICNYWDLQVNTDDVIVNMDFESVYNPQFLIDVDATIDYLDNLGNAVTVLTSDTQIKDTIVVNETITSIYVNEDNAVIAVTVDENGDIQEVVINNNANDIEKTLIQGANGEEFVVNRDGEVMGVDEYKNTGGGRESLVDNYNEEKETNKLSDNLTVNFIANEKQRYGFDKYDEHKTALQNTYPALNNGYRPAYKSVASFSTDIVDVSNSGNNITFKDEMGIPALLTEKQLTLRGSANGADVSLYAYQVVNDTTEKIAGKLNILSFDEQAKRLFIVPVNGSACPEASDLQETLNKIYSQAVTRWTVEKLPNLSDIVFENGNMTHGGTSAISVYNNDQRTIVNSFESVHGKMEGDACYLFFVDNVQFKDRSIAGYMPLQRQVGFIYDNPGLNTVAHELGHGAFNLFHTFSSKNFIATEHSTQNLMDYAGGTELWKHQWELVQNPQNLLFAWAQDEKEGEKVSKGEDPIALIVQELVKQMGLKLGVNSFALVHTFSCSNIGNLNLTLDDISKHIEAKWSPEFPNGKIKIVGPYSDGNGNSDVLSVIFLFEIKEGSINPETDFISGVLPPKVNRVPSIGVYKNPKDPLKMEFIDCSEFTSLLDNYGCRDDISFADQIKQNDYKGRYVNRMLDAIHICLYNKKIDESKGKIGDLFYAEQLVLLDENQPGVDKKIAQLKKVSEDFNKIGELLFDSNDSKTWETFGNYFRISYNLNKSSDNGTQSDEEAEKKFDEYLDRLESQIRAYESKKEMLAKFTDNEAISFFVKRFTDAEIKYLPIELRSKCLNSLTNKDLRSALNSVADPLEIFLGDEDLILRLLKHIKEEDITSLLDELKKGKLLNDIDEDVDDIITWFDDNYKEMLDIIDAHVLMKNNIPNINNEQVNDPNHGAKLIELHEKDRFFNITEGNEGESFISASKILSNGEVSITISTLTGYETYYESDEFGVSIPQIRKTYDKKTIKLPFDEPVALYHNAYLDGADVSKQNKIEVASALKLHYYLQTKKNEDIKTGVSVTIDAVSLVVGVGEISMAIKGAKTLRLVLATCDVASSIGSLVATGSKKYLIDTYGQKGQDYVNSLNFISACLGFVDLSVTGAEKLKNLLKKDVIKVGVFNKVNAEALAEADEATRRLVNESGRIVDEFKNYDSEIADAIKTAENSADVANSTKVPALGEKLNVSDYSTSAKNSIKDKMTPDHIPSFAATKKHLETKLGRELTADEAKKIRDQGTTLLYETELHQQYSRTYGGRNTQEQILNDSKNLFEAAKKDLESIRKALLESGMSNDEINQAFERVHEMNKKLGLY